MANDDGASPDPQMRPLHPLPLRIMHWTNAVAMIIMIGSGWKIYNDEVLFGWLHFPMDHDWRRAGGRLAVAFLRHVDPGDQRPRLCGIRTCDGALPAHAAADPGS